MVSQVLIGVVGVSVVVGGMIHPGHKQPLVDLAAHLILAAQFDLNGLHPPPPPPQDTGYTEDRFFIHCDGALFGMMVSQRRGSRRWRRGVRVMH